MIWEKIKIIADHGCNVQLTPCNQSRAPPEWSPEKECKYKVYRKLLAYASTEGTKVTCELTNQPWSQ